MGQVRFSALWAGSALLGWGLAVAAPCPAQQPGAGRNPFTGKQHGPETNPFTGAGDGRGHNPLTGKTDAPAPNPFTGKTAPGLVAYNPWTGKFDPVQGPAPQAPPPASLAHKMPIHGEAGPGLEEIDAAILAIMERHGIPGAALAIAKDGKLIYAKGLGWADLAAGVPVQPFTVFGLASCSKPITALAILALIEQGKLSLDDRAFDLLKHIQPPVGSRIDPRVKAITIRQLLNHSGGWDRAKSGDPMNQSALIARRLGVPMPINQDQFLSYVLTLPLDFDPGTDMKYSNVGYIILGRIVEKASGLPYEEYIREHVLKPAGVRQAYLNEGTGRYRAGEARCYLPGAGQLLPPMDLRLITAAAGWNTSAVDLVRVLTALDGSRGKALFGKKTFETMVALPPPPLGKRADGTHPGLGWPITFLGPKGTFGYFHDGQLHGMRTFMKRSERGVDWALLFNVAMHPDQADAARLRQAVQDIRRHLEGRKDYPDIDLFSKY